jgi:hypothetical protein
MMHDVYFQKCLKDENMLAHHLAKHAYESQGSRVWEGDPPNLILPFTIRDVTILSA